MVNRDRRQEKMKTWTIERGALWVWEKGDALPEVGGTEVAVEFQEVGAELADDLAGAMEGVDASVIRQRLVSGRRCFCLVSEGQITSYCWVTHGPEWVGEWERQFDFAQDEAYIWNCGTLPAWRGLGLYNHLLTKIVHQLHGEGVARVWIGAARENEPSVRGIESAGFKHALDATYVRLLPLTMVWLRSAPGIAQSLAAAIPDTLIHKRERMLGPVAVGFGAAGQRDGRAAI
jgi:ribosomal protein S18 acetylase RimI-like enzyme